MTRLHFFHKCILMLTGCCLILPMQAQDLWQDTWVGTDGLGRHMPNAWKVGPPKTDKQRTVGIFYITWHDEGCFRRDGSYTDVTHVLNSHPEARLDGENEAWPRGMGSFHWGEPELGYFLSEDRYVIRQDISMLADAGVDVLIMDVTNAVQYHREWKVLFEEMERMKAEGNPVPKFCFWAYNGAVISVVQSLYEKYYKTQKYKDLWFYWEGKPLLLYNARPTLDANGGGARHPNPNYDERAATDPTHPHYGDPDYCEKYYKDYTREVKEFFTLRNMWWGYYKWGGQRYVGTEDNWSFGYDLHDKKVAALSPKQLAAPHKGRLEEMAVTPAQHAVSMVGKSWRRDTGEPELNTYDMPRKTFVPMLMHEAANPVAYGIYFQDRWDEALQADPDFLYLNDWNEWTAGKYKGGLAPGSTTQPGPTTFMGRNPSNFYFVDQYNSEFNRTIQPMKGGYTDNYYMQMAQNIRRYKGARPIQHHRGLVDSAERIDWTHVDGHYLDTRGDIIHRDHNGYGGRHYENHSGRNDILESKVAVDKKNIHFHVRTDSLLTPHTDKHWMLLLLDTDLNDSTGWHGYDFILNMRVKSPSQTALMRYDTWSKGWQEVADVAYRKEGKELEIIVPRKMLGLEAQEFTFDFKWADNPADLKNPISLCTHGDTAPNRRFNYRFIWSQQ